MKKRISLLLVFTLLVSSMILTLTAFGADGVIETPMVPLNPTTKPETQKTEVTVALSSDAQGALIGGQTVEAQTKFSDIPEDKISSVTLSYTYSDSLVFNNDITVEGVSGAEISAVSDSNGVLTFTVSKLSSASSAFAVKFSFTLLDKPERDNSISLSANAKTPANKEVTVKYGKNRVSFTAESVVPAFANLGASLRINNAPALRFGLRVEKDANYISAMGSANFVYSADSKMQFGMLSIQKTALVGELTVDTRGAHNEKFKTVLSENSNEIVFAYTLESFASNTTTYVTRPYVSYTSESGEVVYYYGEVKERTAKFVAEAELQSETDTKKIALLNKFTK